MSQNIALLYYVILKILLLTALCLFACFCFWDTRYIFSAYVVVGMGVSKVGIGMYSLNVCEDESMGLCEIYMTRSEDIQ